MLSLPRDTSRTSPWETRYLDLGQCWLRKMSHDSAALCTQTLWGNTVLEENNLTLAFTTSKSQRLLCVWLHIQSSKRQEREQFCDDFPEHYIHAGSKVLPPVWSEFSESSFSIANAFDSFHTHFKSLFYSALLNVFVLVTAQEKTHHNTYTKMHGHNTRRLKSQHPSKKISKTGRYMANLSFENRIC